MSSRRGRVLVSDYLQSPEFADEVFGPEWREGIPELQPGFHRDARWEESQQTKSITNGPPSWTAILNDWKNRSFEQRFPPASDDPVPGSQYYYHATPLSRLPDFAVQGLIPLTEVTSVVPHLDSARWRGGTTVGGPDDPTLLLRMPRQAVRLLPHQKEDQYDPHEETAEDATVSYIPPHKLEIYDNGRWVPLTRFVPEEPED